MKKEPLNSKTKQKLTIQVTLPDVDVEYSVPVIICQQPAKSIPFLLPFEPRLPRYDVWQVNELFYSYNQSLI